MLNPDNADVGLREDCEEDLVDVGCNADLYVANQESTDSIHEAHVDALFAFIGSSQDLFYLSRLMTDLKVILLIDY